ncbi:MAG: homocitrate synthase [Anaeromyxobacter sp.]
MLRSWKLIDTTLREGEQFAKASFRLEDKLEIARALDTFGVDYIEVTSPAASPQSQRDLAAIVKLGLHARIITHSRCLLDDVRTALDTGVRGIGLFFATSRILRESSHGKSIQQIIDSIGPPVEAALAAGLEVRFSAEDAFRTDVTDLLAVYRAAEKLGVHRVGIADTVGIATPRQVYALVREVRSAVRCDIGFHGHDDTRCSVANAYEALAAGATHVDVSVLGIGERNGIVPLGGMIARLFSVEPQRVGERYRLGQLRELERLVARVCGIEIPFNNPVTGDTAFSHKAGMHLKAMTTNPGSYEVIPPEAFGLTRRLIVGSRLTGKHAIAYRAREMGITFGENELKALTRQIKELADKGELSEEQIDAVLRDWVTA